jgi:hypothetical protein
MKTINDAAKSTEVRRIPKLIAVSRGARMEAAPDSYSITTAQSPREKENPHQEEHVISSAWPVESLEAERRFGHPCAKLYPFLGKKVLTSQGLGVLWQVFEDRVGVVLEESSARVSFLSPETIQVLTESNGDTKP